MTKKSEQWVTFLGRPTRLIYVDRIKHGLKESERGIREIKKLQNKLSATEKQVSRYAAKVRELIVKAQRKY
jgi:hypothetical protein